MKKHEVIKQIEKADRAIVAEDFDTLLDIYTDSAILVIEPGRNAVGKEAINLSSTEYHSHSFTRFFIGKADFCRTSRS